MIFFSGILFIYFLVVSAGANKQHNPSKVILSQHLSDFRDAWIKITTGNWTRRYFCDQKGQFAVLAADSYVHVMLYNRRWAYTKFKARYFLINNTASDGMYIFELC